MKPICKFLLDLRDELQTLIITKKKFSDLIRPLKSLGYFFLEYLEAFLGGHAKVAQNPKVCRKPIRFFLFEYSMCSKSSFFDFYDFLRIFNHNFQKPF